MRKRVVKRESEGDYEHCSEFQFKCKKSRVLQTVSVIDVHTITKQAQGAREQEQESLRAEKKGVRK